jgi:hypothetical protein
MSVDFSQVMSERTNKQLVDIVTTKRDEYQPEALIAAEKELSVRQIDPTTFYYDEDKVTEQPTTIYKEDMPLEKIQILFTVLLPAIFISAWTLIFQTLTDFQFLKRLGFPAIVLVYYVIHKWLKDNGYQRKASEFMKWTTYSLFIYIGLIAIVGFSIYFFAT